jgi:hypothetical protein
MAGARSTRAIPAHYDPTVPLPDARHELFAQLLSDGMTQVGAFEGAGFVPHASNANTLAHHPPVHARTQHLIDVKADRNNVTVSERIIVDLDKVGPDSKKLSPEWFLYRVMVISEDEGVEDDDGNLSGGTKTADKLKALQLGAEWLGYFRHAKKVGVPRKDKNSGVEGVSSDRARRVAAGKTGALSRFSTLVEGVGGSAEEYSQDGGDEPDQPDRIGADAKDITQ